MGPPLWSHSRLSLPLSAASILGCRHSLRNFWALLSSQSLPPPGTSSAEFWRVLATKCPLSPLVLYTFSLMQGDQIWFQATDSLTFSSLFSIALQSHTWLLGRVEEKPLVSLVSWHGPRRSVFLVGVELKKKVSLSYISAGSALRHPPTRMGRKGKYLFYKWMNLIPSSKESFCINYHNFSILRCYWFEDVFIYWITAFFRKGKKMNKLTCQL